MQCISVKPDFFSPVISYYCYVQEGMLEFSLFTHLVILSHTHSSTSILVRTLNGIIHSLAPYPNHHN